MSALFISDFIIIITIIIIIIVQSVSLCRRRAMLHISAVLTGCLYACLSVTLVYIITRFIEKNSSHHQKTFSLDLVIPISF